MNIQEDMHCQIMPILKLSSELISEWKQQKESEGLEGLKLGYKDCQKLSHSKWRTYP